MYLINMLVLLIVFLYSVSYSNWKQEFFIIASGSSPAQFFNAIKTKSEIPDSIEANDLKILKIYKDANFNILLSDCTTPGDAFPTNEYILKVINQIPDLYLLVSDWRLIGSQRPYWIDSNKKINYLNDTTIQDVVNQYKKLPAKLRNYIYGYYIADEPNYADLEPNTGTYLITRIAIMQKNQLLGDPNKISYVNLFSNRVAPFFYNITDGTYDIDRYNKYVDLLCETGVKVISFDNYSFIKSGKKRYLRDKFFLNHELIAKKAIEKKVNFWEWILSNEHVNYTKTGSIKMEHDGPADYRTSIDEPQLRFQAFVPILYGAKGLLWYLYGPGSPNSENASFVNVPGWTYNNKAIVDLNGYPNLDTARPLYTWVKQINGEITNLVPILINLNWCGTFHGSAINNWSSIQAIKNKKPTIKYSTYFENNLPTFSDARNTTIASVSTPDNSVGTIAIGVFSLNNTDYLALLNKDLDMAHTYTITLKKSGFSIWKKSKTDSSWSQYCKTGNSFTTTLSSGNMDLFMLGNP